MAANHKTTNDTGEVGCADALSLLREAGSKRPGDATYDQILYLIANRLAKRCDAVLRLQWASKGADEDVRLAQERGLPVWTSLSEVPGYAELTKDKRMIRDGERAMVREISR